jgi:Cys-tRNA(Pro)/Cys-tRNA(Cys) deacylase
MTPAINALEKAGVKFTVHTYAHDVSHQSYGLEAAEKLAIEPGRVFKTLLTQDGANKPYVGLVPVNTTLNLKKFAAALGIKKVDMASQALAQRATGYVLGGISPVGQKKRNPTVIDDSALTYETIFVSAGRRGLEVELSPTDLQRCTQAIIANIAAV